MRAYGANAPGRDGHEPPSGVAVLDTGEIKVLLGLNVGKGDHHGHGLTAGGRTVFDKGLPNSEPKLRAVFDKLTAKFGRVLVIVDQPASTGGLPLAVARDSGCEVAYVLGMAMRRIADLYPGGDAHVIADAARACPTPYGPWSWLTRPLPSSRC